MVACFNPKRTFEAYVQGHLGEARQYLHEEDEDDRKEALDAAHG